MITFHNLYQKYVKDVYRFAYWLCGSAMEAEDITAETFTRKRPFPPIITNT